MTARLQQPLDAFPIGAAWELNIGVYGATTADPVTLSSVYSGARLVLSRNKPQGAVLAAADIISLTLGSGLTFAGHQVLIRRTGAQTADAVAGTYELEFRLTRLSDGVEESWISGVVTVGSGAASHAVGAAAGSPRLTGGGAQGLNLFTGIHEVQVLTGVRAAAIDDVYGLQAALDAKADETITVTGGGLATGGGNLTANRTITVTAASQAEAQAGTATTVVLTPQRGTDLLDARRGAANGVASLDGAGLIPTSQLPALAITETFAVADQAAMLALSAQKGDVAIRADNGKSYILSTNSPSTLGDWLEMTATGQVQSVAGRIGNVVLAIADVVNLQAALDAKASLAGATMAGVLAFVAGTVSAPGLAVAGDLNTGIYQPIADALAVTAGGQQVQSWAPGTSTLTGHLLNGTDATYDLGASGANRFRDGYLSRNLTVGATFTRSGGSYSTVIDSTGVMVTSPSGQNPTFRLTQTGIRDLSIFLRATSGETVFSGGTITEFVNGSTAQTARVYNTTSGADYERGTFGWSSNILVIGAEVGGAGTARSIRLKADGAASVFFSAGGTDRWAFGSTGHWTAIADNTYDFGGTSSGRARTGYFGTNVVIGYSTTSTAALHVGPGGPMSIINGIGGSIASQAMISQTSGTSVITVGVNDGTNNRRAGLFVDQTNAVWGLSATLSTGVMPFAINIAGTEVLRITSAGITTLYNNLLFGTDATYDVGAAAANRPRDLNASRNIIAGGYLQTGSYVKFGAGGAQLYSPSVSALTLYNNTASDFGLLQWGGATSSFPAIGKSGTQIRFRLADDSAYTSIRATSYALNGGQYIDAASTTGFTFMDATSASYAYFQVEGANIWAQRVGTSAQTHRIYGTWATSGTDYERLAIIAGTAAAYDIAVQAGGTGVQRDLRLDGATLILRAAGTSRMTVSASGFMPVADATYDIGSASLRFYAGLFSNSIKIGGAAPAGSASLSVIQAFGQAWATIGGDNVTDATAKGARWGVAHYTNTQAPLTVFYGTTTVAASSANIGGGTSSGNAATDVNIFTAANNTTLTGTNRWRWDGSGHYFPIADNTYNIGYAANRVATVFGVIGDYTGRVHAYSGTAIPAGGTGGVGLRLSSTTNFGVFFGSGAPTLSAAKGSIYLRSDGTTTNDRAYINTDGGTTWTALTTAT